jgi:hypothetical protein
VNKQLGMLTVVATVLLSAAFLTIPTMKVANAQGNETKSTNETKSIDVEGWINTLKENHPNIEQAQDVKDVIGKIKAMEAKEAVKDLLALRVLNDLMDLKAAQEGQ